MVVVITEEVILRMAAERMIMELWVPLVVVVVVVLLLFKFKCSTIGATATAMSNGVVYNFAYDANDVALGFEGNRSCIVSQDMLWECDHIAQCTQVMFRIFLY